MVGYRRCGINAWMRNFGKTECNMWSCRMFLCCDLDTSCLCVCVCAQLVTSWVVPGVRIPTKPCSFVMNLETWVLLLKSNLKSVPTCVCYLLATRHEGRKLQGSSDDLQCVGVFNMGHTYFLGGGFKHFFIFTPTWGNDPIWLIFWGWVETTNQIRMILRRDLLENPFSWTETLWLHSVDMCR